MQAQQETLLPSLSPDEKQETREVRSETYVVETMPSVTGFKADHALRLKPSEVEAFASSLAGGGGSREKGTHAGIVDPAASGGCG